MIVIDTDHATYLKYPESERGKRFVARLDSLPAHEDTCVPIVTIEERLRGWLAVIAKERQALRQVIGYRELGELFEFYNLFTILPFDDDAARKFNELRAAKVRLGTRDLKIAAITLVSNATLLTANRSDFEKVPGLRIANWLD